MTTVTANIETATNTLVREMRDFMAFSSFGGSA
jgi:hypothetical protein